MENNRYCPDCREYKALVDFPTDEVGNSGYHCKECISQKEQKLEQLKKISHASRVKPR